MKPTNASKVAKSSIWLTGCFVLEKLLQLLSQVLLARLLAPEEFGIWAMVLIMTTLSLLFKDNAIASVLIQRGVEDQRRVNGVYSLAINISLGMFVLQALMGYPLSVFFSQPILWPLTAVSGLVFIIGAGNGTRGAIMQRQMQFRELAIFRIVLGVTRLVVAVTAAHLGAGVWAFAAAQVVSEAVLTVAVRFVCRYPLKYNPFVDREVVKDVRGYVASMVGINLAVYANTNTDNFVIGRLLGATQLGFYSVAYQLAMVPAFAISQVNKVSFSVLSRKDNAGQEAYVRKMMQFYAIFYALICSSAFTIAPWLIPTLYGPEWAAAVLPFQIILVFAYARGFMSILGTALNAMDKPALNAMINWVLVPISVISFWVGAQTGGVVGVAVMVAVVMGIGASAWFWITTCRAAGWNVLTLASPIALPTGMAVLAIALTRMLPESSAMSYILKTLLVVVIYVAGISLFSGGEIPRMVFSVFKQALQSKKPAASSN